jgi:transcription elongation factor Elf1
MWLDKKYIMLLGSVLPKFKQRSSDLWVFRCPVCGDSEKNKNKTRGYIYNRKGKYQFHCHNCSASHQFKYFLKLMAPALYDAYVLESIQEENITSPEKVLIKTINELPDVPISQLKKVSQLGPFDPVKKYLIKRQIPTPFHAKLYYCPLFKKWTNSILPGKFENVDKDEARLIIPIRNSNEQIIGYQGRALDDNEIRYITIMLSDEYARMYGVECCNFNQTYYCFEGPFDSMFIPNSLATCGGKMITELDILNRVKHNAVVVYDNEPRNRDIVNSIAKTIKAGYKVCIWPDTMKDKDINDMILTKVGKGHEYVKTELVGRAAAKIKDLIDANTFRGLQAELRLAEWRKT